MEETEATTAFELEQFLPYLLNQVAEAVGRSFQACYQKDFGLTRTQWRILAHLYALDGQTAKQIAARIHEDKVSLSRGVAGLETAGRLTRRTNPRDRRFESLHLTPEGRALFTRLSLRAATFEDGLAHKVGAESVAQLRGLLTRMLPLLEQGQPED